MTKQKRKLNNRTVNLGEVLDEGMTTLASEQSGMLLSEQQEASKAAERAAVAEKEAAIARTAEEVAKQATTRAEKETAIARTAEAEAIRMAEEAKQATMRLGKHFCIHLQII